VLLAYLKEPVRMEIYNSMTLNDCPDDLWRALDNAFLTQELVVDTTHHVATVLQDDLENTYTLVG
jgi:hypothetical protein